MSDRRMVYDVSCYRCRERERETVENETRAQEKVEEFKQTHRAKCGDAASFSTQIAAA